jgi:hypothetical protein
LLQGKAQDDQPKNGTSSNTAGSWLLSLVAIIPPESVKDKQKFAKNLSNQELLI